MFFYSESDSGVGGGGVSLADWSNFAETKLQPSDYSGGSFFFGYSNSMNTDGNLLAVGARGDNSVYVFQNNNGIWNETQKLVASDGESGFGASENGVAISQDGSTMIIGAAFGNGDPGGATRAGSAYVFKNINGTWTEVQKLTASDKSYDDRFGQSIAISQDGSVICIGAHQEDPDAISNAGSVYVFQNNGGSWAEVQKLTASDKESGDLFGEEISLSGDGSVLVVGARFENSRRGAAYVFQNINDTWTEVQKLTASDRSGSDFFGESISINQDGSILAIGAYGEDPDGISNAGSVYIFENNNGVWTELQKITTSDKQPDDSISRSALAINGQGNALAIGAYTEDPDDISNAGSAYIFHNINGTWTEVQKLTASDQVANCNLGCSVSISDDGSAISVGAYGTDSYQGAVYIFQAS